MFFEDIMRVFKRRYEQRFEEAEKHWLKKAQAKEISKPRNG